MSTPEKPRPSLDETLSLIDDTLAAQTALPPLPPVVGDYLSGIPLDVRPLPCRCVVTPVEPVVRDGNTFTVTTPGIYAFGAELGRAGLRSVAEASAELLGRERPPAEPLVVVPPMKTGWLARALHRLFT
ncbi:hypothetical protein [Amycolatopsis vancoresmycina]|uniref:Uncharacterized protein n=1 Tax=Amycolatopsis vancoresmycina DSM 44592 TaxID=1292037 RepID=R1I2X8_9PSEU|nr:hypothetical protein [Amycolatopsis vancoresmycina]EOD66881.1 hypothetical protein H480_19198 [Amycolatopsis vancoresmycina DSM 44592]